MRLLRVKPISALTVGFYVHCVLGMLLSLVLGIVRLLNSFEMTRSDYQGTLLTGLRVLSLPVIVGLAGGTWLAILASIFNFTSKWTGGLEIELKERS